MDTLIRSRTLVYALASLGPQPRHAPEVSKRCREVRFIGLAHGKVVHAQASHALFSAGTAFTSEIAGAINLFA